MLDWFCYMSFRLKSQNPSTTLSEDLLYPDMIDKCYLRWGGREHCHGGEGCHFVALQNCRCPFSLGILKRPYSCLLLLPDCRHYSQRWARSHGCVRFKQFKILAWHQSLVGPETGSERTAIEMIPVFKNSQEKTHLRFLYIVNMGWNFINTSYANAYIGWILSNPSWAKNPHTFEQFGKAREVGYTFVALSWAGV